MLKGTRGEDSLTGTDLAEIIYFEAWAKAVVKDAKPTPAWQCEVISEAAKQRAPCKISVVTPKGSGAQVTVAIEPRWFDSATDAVLRLAGLHCAACVWLLERLPKVVPGVSSARVDFGASLLHLRWDPAQVKLSKIAAFVDDLGDPPSLAAAHGEQESSRRDRPALWRIGVTGALAANAMLSSFALYAGADELVDRSFQHMFEWIGFLCALPCSRGSAFR